MLQLEPQNALFVVLFQHDTLMTSLSAEEHFWSTTGDCDPTAGHCDAIMDDFDATTGSYNATTVILTKQLENGISPKTDQLINKHQ